jgi:hypothetical protein
VEKIGGGRSTRPTDHVAWSSGHHSVLNRLIQLGGAPPRPINTPPTVEMRGHTPHFGDSTCKALILSVVARRSLVGKVARL